MTLCTLTNLVPKLVHPEYPLSVCLGAVRTPAVIKKPGVDLTRLSTMLVTRNIDPSAHVSYQCSTLATRIRPILIYCSVTRQTRLYLWR